jgi:hypothetical protein
MTQGKRPIGKRLIDDLGLSDPAVAANRGPGRSKEWHARQRQKCSAQVPESVADVPAVVQVDDRTSVEPDQSVTLRLALDAIGPDAVKAVGQVVRGVGRFRNAPASVRYQAAKDVLQAQGLLRPQATLAERATADMSPEELRRFIAEGQAALERAQQSGSTVIEGTFAVLPSVEEPHSAQPDMAQAVTQQPDYASAVDGTTIDQPGAGIVEPVEQPEQPGRTVADCDPAGGGDPA